MCSTRKRRTNEVFEQHRNPRTSSIALGGGVNSFRTGGQAPYGPRPPSTFFSPRAPGVPLAIGCDRCRGPAPFLRVSDWGRLAQLRPSAPRATGSKHGGPWSRCYRPRCGGILAGPEASVLRGRNAGFGDCGVPEVPRTGGRGVVSDKIPSYWGAVPSHRDSYKRGRRASECQLLGLLRVRGGAGT